jgi:ketosteroid isomerase-like protein
LKSQEVRAILDRYWAATMASDLERVHEFYHDDVVVEFPQSGKRMGQGIMKYNNIIAIDAQTCDS